MNRPGESPDVEAPLPVRSFAGANAELVAAFERYVVAKNLAESTRRHYVRMARAFAVFLGPTSAAAAGRRELQTFLSSRGKSPAVYNSDRVALRSFCRFLVLAGVAAHSSAHLIRRPKMRRPLPRVLTESEMERLIAAAASPRDRALVELLYASGLRAGEAAKLRIEDLDLDAGTLRVVRGKGDKDRVGYAGSRAVEALRAYLGPRQTGPVFLNAWGNALRPTLVSDVVSATAKSAGLEGVHAHTLRHTFATVLLNRGADIRYVQELLGHELVSTTQIYTHLAIADLARTHARCHPHAEGESDGRR